MGVWTFGVYVWTEVTVNLDPCVEIVGRGGGGTRSACEVRSIELLCVATNWVRQRHLALSPSMLQRRSIGVWVIVTRIWNLTTSASREKQKHFCPQSGGSPREARPGYRRQPARPTPETPPVEAWRSVAIVVRVCEQSEIRTSSTSTVGGWLLSGSWVL